MRERSFVIINPGAGQCDPAVVTHQIQSHFDWAGLTYDILIPAGAEALREEVRERLRDGCRLFVVAGGDGTVSTVAAELAGSSASIGIVPVGTANILARDLRIPLDTADAVRLIAGPHEIRTIDAMKIEGRLYFLTAGVGISSLTVRDIRHRDKRRFGLLAYAATAIGKLLIFRSARFEVIVDGESYRLPSLEVAVANSGGVVDMVLSTMPDIRPDDGALDVIIVVTRGPVDYPRIVWSALRGRVHPASIRRLRAKREVVIRPSRTLPVQADGDVVGTSPVEVRVVPHAVQVIVPPRAAT